jgi:type II secretory pathway component PulF
MSEKRPPKPGVDDLVWFCRRLASALQEQAPVLTALDAMSQDAPPRLHSVLPSIRSRLRAAGPIPDALDELGWPSFASAMARSGEDRNDLGRSLTLVAEALELEQSLPGPLDRELHAFGLAFGRLAAMYRAGVPTLTALECAAESVAGARAREVLMATRDAVRGGEVLAEALDRLAPELPEMTTEIIRDGERDGRLGDVLAVVADYLFDESGEGSTEPRKQEVRNA